MSCLALVGLASVSLLANGAVGSVSFSKLLEEMTDSLAVTRFPEPAYSIRSWSSYDRKSVSPGNPGWFANEDWNNFIRSEGAEQVMVDAKGPGAIVRIWCAGVNMSNGLVRVYLDGAAKPTFADEAFDLCGGTALCGEPFSFSCAVNPKKPEQSGRNLMLPIPYAKSCKVTFEPKMKDCRFWYNVETRTYAEGTAVETLTPDVLTANRAKMERTGQGLMRQAMTGPWEDPYDSFIPPGESVEIAAYPRKSAAVIRGLSLRLDDAKPGTLPVTSALERVSVAIACDGEETVSMPLGAFFGTGPWERSPFRTRVAGVEKSGTMENLMPMPYRKSFVLKLVNGSDKPVWAAGISLCNDDYEWIEGRSMHLTARYERRRGIPTTKDGKDYDLTFDDVKGKGVLVGTTVFVDNPSTYKACPWWGEGDEKIWVDGERFPSVFGTGSEDYFNYAWSRPEPFAWPFCAQPSGAGNLAVGKSANIRWRALDALPFTQALRFDMELWHWDKACTVDYDSVSWRYLLLPETARLGEPLTAPDYPKVRVYRDLAYGPRKDLPDEGAGCPHTSLGKRYLPGTMANTHRSGQSFDVYLPCERKDLKGDEPVMLYVHGGAWHWLGDKDSWQELFCWIAENAGYVVVSMNYILQPFDTKQTPKRKEATFGAMLGDIDLCVSHLKRVLPEQFGITVERIAIGGESAGGHLASLYAYDEAHPEILALGLKHELKIGFLLNHCGAIDLTTPLIEHEFPNDPMTMEYRRRFSPVNMIRKGSTPTLFVYSSLRPGAEGDGAIPVENFTTATNLCAQAGVEYRVHFNPQCPHAGTLSSRRPEGRRWLKDSLRDWRGKLK